VSLIETWRGRLRQPTLRAMLENSGWHVLDRLVRVAIGLTVTVWIARYLGPGPFGQLSYAIAAVALFSAVGTLGLNGIVVRDLVRQSADAPATLGTAALLQALGGAIGAAAAVGLVLLLRPGDATLLVLTSILGSAMVFRAADVVRYWYEARIQSKHILRADAAVLIVMSGARVALILCGAPLLAFAAVALAETVVAGAAILAVYAAREGTLARWRVTRDRLATLLRDCWPLLLSGLAVSLYLRADQIMLGRMLGDEQVGQYAAAVRIIEAFNFLPLAVVASAFPALMSPDAKPQFERRFGQLLEVMVALSIPLAAGLSFFAGDLTRLLYGERYADAAPVLALYAWTLVFVFLGTPSGRWYLYADLQKLALSRTALAAILNVLLNLWLIPRWGLTGAATGTLVAVAVSNVLFNALDARTRPIFWMQLRSLALPSLYARWASP
jgi:O-antigen/teichoic acid export membrane protein